MGFSIAGIPGHDNATAARTWSPRNRSILPSMCSRSNSSSVNASAIASLPAAASVRHNVAPSRTSAVAPGFLSLRSFPDFPGRLGHNVAQGVRKRPAATRPSRTDDTADSRASARARTPRCVPSRPRNFPVPRYSLALPSHAPATNPVPSQRAGRVDQAVLSMLD